MLEVDLNNGVYRRIDLSKPVFCAKCGKEIVRDGNSNSVSLEIDVLSCGYAFCKNCKKELNKFAGQKVADFEKKLADEFIERISEKKVFKQWLAENGGEKGVLFQTFPDEELERIFLTAYLLGRSESLLRKNEAILIKNNIFF